MKNVYKYLKEDKMKRRDRPYISMETSGRFAARMFAPHDDLHEQRKYLS